MMKKSMLNAINKFIDMGFSREQAINLYIADQLTAISYNLYKIANKGESEISDNPDDWIY